MQKQKFKGWLENNTELVDKTIDNYISSIKNIPKHCSSSFNNINIYEVTDHYEYEKLSKLINEDTDFQEFNTQGHKMHSNALRHYGNFLYSIYKTEELSESTELLLLDEKEVQEILNNNKTLITDTEIPKTKFYEVKQIENFKAQKIDFNKLNIRNSKIGNKAEELVLEIENKKLMNYKKKPEHVSKTIGDGLGYDILSYNKETGKEIYIEVKGSIRNNKEPFFLSKNEWEFIQYCKNKNKEYYIYRVYNLQKEPRCYIITLEDILTNYDLVSEQYCVYSKNI